MDDCTPLSDNEKEYLDQADFGYSVRQRTVLRRVRQPDTDAIAWFEAELNETRGQTVDLVQKGFVCVALIALALERVTFMIGVRFGELIEMLAKGMVQKWNGRGMVVVALR